MNHHFYKGSVDSVILEKWYVCMRCVYALQVCIMLHSCLYLHVLQRSSSQMLHDIGLHSYDNVSFVQYTAMLLLILYVHIPINFLGHV